MGVWEDKPWGALEREYALNLIRFNHCSPEFRVRGGETFAQVQARIRETVFRLAAAHPGQTIALFSHGTAIRCLQAALRGLGPGEMDGLGHSDNTAVTCLEIQGDQARITTTPTCRRRSPPWPGRSGGRSGTGAAATPTCGSAP